MSNKVTLQHRQRVACIYIRQSTMGQVLHHQESTQRAARGAGDTAVSPGQAIAARVRILDRDLGTSGSQAAGRDDFKALVADGVDVGRGGPFCAEASRPARPVRRLAPTHRAVLAHGHPADRRGRVLRHVRFQRQAPARGEGDHVPGRAPLPLRPDARRQTTQGRQGGVAPAAAGGPLLRRPRARVLDPTLQARGPPSLLPSACSELGSRHRGGPHSAQGPSTPRDGGAWTSRYYGRLDSGSRCHQEPGLRRDLRLWPGRAQGGLRFPGRGEVPASPRAARRMAGRDPCDHHAGYITPEDYFDNLEALRRNRLDDACASASGPEARGLEALLHGMLIMRRLRPLDSRSATRATEGSTCTTSATADANWTPMRAMYAAPRGPRGTGPWPTACSRWPDPGSIRPGLAGHPEEPGAAGGRRPPVAICRCNAEYEVDLVRRRYDRRPGQLPGRRLTRAAMGRGDGTAGGDPAGATPNSRRTAPRRSRMGAAASRSCALVDDLPRTVAGLGDVLRGIRSESFGYS